MNWPPERCPVCSSPPSQRVLLGAVRCFECLTYCMELGEYHQGRNCVEPTDDEEPRQTEQDSAGDTEALAGGLEGAPRKKARSRQQAGLPKPSQAVRKRRGA